MMKVAHTLETSHEDLIHDVAYDFYGKRMATCSSDQHIKVWDMDENGNWQLTADWKAHAGSVWKVCWAHPEFGQVLASCSFDCTVALWEQEPASAADYRSAANSGGQPLCRWVKRTSLVDSRSSVKDIAFAPKHMGLKLATCSGDGMVRIYEAMDVMNLTHWPLMEEFEGRKGGCRCISWNPSRFHPPMLAAGSDDPAVKIWEYHEAYRRWIIVESLAGHADAVHDVAFAPNMGRSFHLLATASRDQTVKIWKLTPRGESAAAGGGGTKLDVQMLADFSGHGAQVWRVEWNITGTILASSGDDGTVRLWKANFLNEWECVSVVHGD